MENKKIADLLYPNAKPTSFWEQKYPPRNLPNGAEVTRFAPSPTGYLHIGHFFQSLCDKFIAKSTNGVFYFRVEDTDKKREVADSVDVAIDTLSQFGIEYDEGVLKGGKEKGNYGPYTQSQRLEIYNSFAKYLVEKGKAYPCFCEKPENFAEILEKRSEQLEENETLEEKDVCRNLSFIEIEEKIKQKKPFALRLKSFGNFENIIKFSDVVKGEREIRENQKDIVLIKSNGLPVYAFAHAVDDHLMRTTLVVRGEEWYPSVSSHLELFDALDFKRVKYAHNPVICKLDENGNKRKVSKRKDKEADMRFFVQAGYPSNAILEYLLNLANSNFEIWRKNNPTTPIADFNFSAQKITPSNPMFDFAKLNDISKTIISKMTAEEILSNILLWAEIFDKEIYKILSKDKTYSLKVLNIDRDTPKPRKDIAKYEDVKTVWGYMFDDLFDSDYELEDTNIENMKEVLKEYIKIYEPNDTKDEWFDRIKEMSDKLGYAVDNKLFKQNPQNYKGNVALVCEYIRIAITGKKNSPDLYSICQVLGEQKTIARLMFL
ncbi:MAG: glutamate--tRNA ligase family protein [Clostridia bacterium]|nr:glutamate--tRNA ligase family protein [Clostridia bacterium]